MEKSNAGQYILICDAGPILHLDELHCLHLLQDFQKVILPPTVAHEIQRYRPSIIQQSAQLFQIISVTPPPTQQLQILKHVFTLHQGEIEALTLVQDWPGAILLTDDNAARFAAQALQYRVHGTIGILLRAIRRQQMSPQEVIALLQSLPTMSSLHIKPTLLQEMITRIQEEYAVSKD